ncbi:DUF1801 domain-containing protein, partial [Stenotrophomonas sp. FR012]|uniref:DUF1801 domain-containing protein n=1 Tax=Stenotrophomonas sp. FR012 TaxID=3398457 RepID=UPI0039C65B7D
MPAKRTAPSTAPTLLSGGNPQIAKGEGDAPVQAYIAAMPDWKRPIGARLDALIEQAVPGVHKAVKWNSPMYAVAPGEGWFLSFHCFTRYIKVAFFRGGGGGGGGGAPPATPRWRALRPTRRSVTP